MANVAWMLVNFNNEYVIMSLWQNWPKRHMIDVQLIIIDSTVIQNNKYVISKPCRDYRSESQELICMLL